MEQFEDILRTFVNDTNSFENKFGMCRDEETMLAARKLMLESLLNLRFRGTTMSYSELLVSLENIIIDKAATVSTVRNRKVDTSASMEIAMAMRDDGGSVREEDLRTVNLALQAVHKGIGKGYFGGRGGKGWRKELICKRAAARKAARNKKKVPRAKPDLVRHVEK